MISARIPHSRLRPVVLLAPLVLGGCSAIGLSTSVGPSRSEVLSSSHQGQVLDGVQIIDLNTSPYLLPQPSHQPSFAEVLGDVPPAGDRVIVGDSLIISIVEAPPAALFGATTLGAADATGTAAGGAAPAAPSELLVDTSGSVFVPFAGKIQAAGRTTNEIEQDITRKLAGKAHLPQVNVRLNRNGTVAATVMGDVRAAIRMPLTPRGERLLDAIAAAGGTVTPTDKTLVQITRGPRVVSMPLATVIRDPANNVTLAMNDVITLVSQKYSFTVLGVASKPGEVPFEATGITLAQALGRVGGLQDQRADPRGMFLFRWENPTDVPNASPGVMHRKDGRIPVIYQIDMKNPGTYLLIQNFAVKDGDVIYVANSGISEFRNFFAIIASTVLPVAAVGNAF